MRRTAGSFSSHGPAKPNRDANLKAPSFLKDLKPSVLKTIQANLRRQKLGSKYESRLDPHEMNTDNGIYVFNKRHVDMNQAKYWSPPSLRSDGRATSAVAAESVCVDTYFEQTAGDSSFIATPYWFRLRNRRDFYSYDDFAAVLLVEAYWESLLVKVLEPLEPLFKRTGWSKWTVLSLAKQEEIAGSALTSAELNQGVKQGQNYVVSSPEDPSLVGLKRPFRQRFFALFAAITGDYHGDGLIQDIIQDRVNEFKVGLKLWLNPSLLTKTVGQAVPNSADALKHLVPAGKLTRTGFLPRDLQFLSFGGVYQYQFPLPYNLAGKLHLHPNMKRALQDRHQLDFSNFGSVFHTHASWQPHNERRVGSAGTGYAIDRLYGSPADAKTHVTYPGLESEARTNSINAIFSSLWTSFLRRTYYNVRPDDIDGDHLTSTLGLPVYRRRDTSPFGDIRVNLFKKRTFRQLHTTDSLSVSKIWTLRPRSRPLELAEDLLNSSNSLESYFTNVDRALPSFAQVVVKA